MKSIKFIIPACALFAIAACAAYFMLYGDKGGNGVEETAGAVAPKQITVYPPEAAYAFENPLEGFRPTRFFQNAGFASHEYATVYKHYIPYTDLEEKASDTAQKIIDWSDKAWAGIEKKNIKVVPRVVIVYPGDGEFWAEGIPHGDPIEQWTSDILKERLVAFVAKMGEAWDRDPRVAYVEASLWGDWGEHHIYPHMLADGTPYIPPDFQKALGDAFVKAFPNKKVTVRYPFTFKDYDFGFSWDSFAHPNDGSSGNGIVERDSWRTQINGGEVAYNWGDYETQPGKDPDTSLKEEKHRNYVIDWIKKTHTSGVGWIDMYNAMNEEVAAGAAEVQKAFGYRFVVKQAVFPDKVEQGGILRMSFDVVNKGSAPFYYPWPVEASLLREDRTVAWTGIFETDIRRWLPGEAWDSELREYRKQPPVMTVSTDFKLPPELEEGTYTLALAILDPAGNRPSARFANSNYYKGGRHPLGKIGVGQMPGDQNLRTFDNLRFDRTLFYDLK